MLIKNHGKGGKVAKANEVILFILAVHLFTQKVFTGPYSVLGSGLGPADKKRSRQINKERKGHLNFSSHFELLG